MEKNNKDYEDSPHPLKDMLERKIPPIDASGEDFEDAENPKTFRTLESVFEAIKQHLRNLP